MMGFGLRAPGSGSGFASSWGTGIDSRFQGRTAPRAGLPPEPEARSPEPRTGGAR